MLLNVKRWYSQTCDEPSQSLDDKHIYKGEGEGVSVDQSINKKFIFVAVGTYFNPAERSTTMFYVLSYARTRGQAR